jgi:hypothetical protein
MLATMTSRPSSARAQRLPNRRFRRLLPAVLAAATIAAAVPLGGPPPAHAGTPPQVHVPPPAPSKAVVPRTSVLEGSTGQAVTGT